MASVSENSPADKAGIKGGDIDVIGVTTFTSSSGFLNKKIGVNFITIWRKNRKWSTMSSFHFASFRSIASFKEFSLRGKQRIFLFYKKLFYKHFL